MPPTDNSIPARIRARREYLKLNQVVLADAIGRSRATIAGMEAGNTPITAADLDAFGRVLKVPRSYFYEDESEPTSANYWRSARARCTHRAG